MSTRQRADQVHPLRDAISTAVVNVLDLVLLANGWLTGGDWTDGDFDYSGFVDQHDLGLMSLNWQAGNGAPLGWRWKNWVYRRPTCRSRWSRGAEYPHCHQLTKKAQILIENR